MNITQVFQEDGGKRLAKWGTIALVLFSIFLLVRVLGDLKKLPNAGKEIYPQSTVMVSGDGEAYAIPDVATFNFSVVEVGATVKQAQEKADQKISKALSSVRETGIEEKDIKTTNYSVYPKYEWEQTYCIQMVGAVCPPGKNVLTGYEVNQTITVKVRDVEKAADLVTKVGAAGVSNISGLEFTVDDKEKYIEMARSQAIEKAKNKAKQLAKDLDVRLGRMLYFNENGNYVPYYGMDYAMGLGGGEKGGVAVSRAELPTGETKIVSQVTITYEIK
jgi:hypothetical protein